MGTAPLVLATRNAHKLREFRRLLAPAGIEAAALAGAPGIFSARYAGADASDEENLAKLLQEAPAGSVVKYICALAYVDPASGDERLFYGECNGRLASRTQG